MPKITIETSEFKATRDFGQANASDIVYSIEEALEGVEALNSWVVSPIGRVQDSVNYTR